MAQLRQDRQEFASRDVVVAISGPDSRQDFVDFWQRNAMPFIGLPDSLHAVADAYGQQVNWFKAGRMPALMLIDQRGYLRYEHHGKSMADILPDDALLAMIDLLLAEEHT